MMNSTTSAEDLQKLSRKELQALAKNYGVKGNASNATLIENITMLIRNEGSIGAKDVPDTFINYSPNVADAILDIDEKLLSEISEPFKVGEEVLITSFNAHGIVKRVNKTTIRIIVEDGNERTVPFSDCKKIVTSNVSIAADPVVNPASNHIDQSFLIVHEIHAQTQIAISDKEEPLVHATNVEQNLAPENPEPVISEHATTSREISIAVVDTPFCNNDSAISHTKVAKKSSTSTLKPRSNRAEEIRRKANIARALPSSSSTLRRETKTATAVKRTPLSVSAVNPMRKKITSSLHGASTVKTASSFTGKSCKDNNKSLFKITTNNDNQENLTKVALNGLLQEEKADEEADKGRSFLKAFFIPPDLHQRKPNLPAKLHASNLSEKNRAQRSTAFVHAHKQKSIDAKNASRKLPPASAQTLGKI